MMVDDGRCHRCHALDALQHDCGLCRGVAVLLSPRLWLFHGTRESAAECITENEFQVRMAGSNRGTMFGPGIYLADSVSRSTRLTRLTRLKCFQNPSISNIHLSMPDQSAIQVTETSRNRHINCEKR